MADADEKSVVTDNRFVYCPFQYSTLAHQAELTGQVFFLSKREYNKKGAPVPVRQLFFSLFLYGRVFLVCVII